RARSRWLESCLVGVTEIFPGRPCSWYSSAAARKDSSMMMQALILDEERMPAILAACAAPRYGAGRMRRITSELLALIGKETVRIEQRPHGPVGRIRRLRIRPGAAAIALIIGPLDGTPQPLIEHQPLDPAKLAAVTQQQMRQIDRTAGLRLQGIQPVTAMPQAIGPQAIRRRRGRELEQPGDHALDPQIVQRLAVVHPKGAQIGLCAV